MFFGGMDYLLNIDAVLYFSKKVLPLIWEKRPDVQFFIVGRNAVSKVRALDSEPTITVTGTVPDVTPYYERASVTVVPLRVGSGTRLKIVEAMAFGRVVVSSTIGVEGLLYKNGEHLLLADDPKHMAHFVVKVLQDPNLRKRIALSARKHVEVHYDCNHIAQELNSFYRELLRKRSSHL